MELNDQVIYSTLPASYLSLFREPTPISSKCHSNEPNEIDSRSPDIPPDNPPGLRHFLLVQLVAAPPDLGDQRAHLLVVLRERRLERRPFLTLRDRVTPHLIETDGEHRVQILVGAVLLLDDRLEDALELEKLGVEREIEGERERDGGFLVLGWCVLWHGGGLMKARIRYRRW